MVTEGRNRENDVDSGNRKQQGIMVSTERERKKEKERERERLLPLPDSKSNERGSPAVLRARPPVEGEKMQGHPSLGRIGSDIEETARDVTTRHVILFEGRGPLRGVPCWRWGTCWAGPFRLYLFSSIPS